MSNLQDFPLYIKTYQLQKYLYQLVKNFRKEYKYTLGQDILTSTWELLDTVIMTNTLPNSEKEQCIRQSSAVFDQLKTRLQLAHELKLMSNRQYSFVIIQTEEIGKMLAGWYGWAQKKRLGLKISP